MSRARRRPGRKPARRNVDLADVGGMLFYGDTVLLLEHEADDALRWPLTPPPVGDAPSMSRDALSAQRARHDRRGTHSPSDWEYEIGANARDMFPPYSDWSLRATDDPDEIERRAARVRERFGP